MGIIGALPGIMSSARDRYVNITSGKCSGEPPELRCVMRSGKDPAGEIFHCDNLTLLSRLIKDGTRLDMIYCDPPFFTGEEQLAAISLRDPDSGRMMKIGAYGDGRRETFESYLEELALRLMLMRDVLSDRGSIFIHLDHRAVHEVKLLMDEIFGREHFINEIIWKYKSGGSSKRKFASKHDTILFYSRSDSYLFNVTREKSYNRKFRKYSFKGVQEFQDDVGWYTLVNTTDVWNMDMVGRSSSERLNYATQKPVALVRRIIESATEPGALCGDLYCGSGTMAEAAYSCGRRFICADRGELAMSNTVRRCTGRGIPFAMYEDGAAAPGDGFSARVGRVGDRPQVKECTVDLDRTELTPGNRKKLRSIYERAPEELVEMMITGERDPEGIFLTEEEDKGREALVFDIFGRRCITEIE